MNDIGRLSHRVRVERLVETADGAGGFSRTWVLHTTLWAKLRHVRGEESLTNDALTARIRTQMIYRSTHPLEPTMRCIINMIPYHILWITPHTDDPHYSLCLLERIS
ncbi:MAG: head-tail adaptor protein [Alphaproteobacteria bacterium]|nr:MAG: head-tail adaptor protein [Alphaproteobacteria bacterium]